MFWNNFYNLCIEKGVKPNPVAKELGISTGIVSKWKNEKTLPNGETLLKIAEHFNVSIDYLVGRKSDKELEPKEYIELYNNLDSLDQAEIRGEIKQMLKADKYKKNYTLPPLELAAYGAEETKGTYTTPTEEIT